MLRVLVKVAAIIGIATCIQVSALAKDKEEKSAIDFYIKYSKGCMVMRIPAGCYFTGLGFEQGFFDEDGKKYPFKKDISSAMKFYGMGCNELDHNCHRYVLLANKINRSNLNLSDAVKHGNTGCFTHKHQETCNLTGRLISKDDSVQAQRKSLDYFSQACKLSSEDGCKLAKLTIDIIRLESEISGYDNQLNAVEKLICLKDRSKC